MPVSLSHRREDRLDETEGNFDVEEIRHRVNEDRPRFLPRQRDIKSVWVEGQFEVVYILLLPHSLKAMGHDLGITVVTAGTKVVTSGGWIPCRVCPFD